MARYGQRPENALKRANEFIDVGKPARALDTLQEVFRNKKWAYNWSESVLEPIMFKYLDLCVELKKSHIAKEGLFQYRNMFQSVNVGSLENVIRGYLRMAEEKTENAREQSAQAVVDIDDLDNLATPESILLSAVSGEDAQDRSDRTILTPWVKFLWESYCQCLELLRTNAHVETLYHDIGRMAFQFCLKYNRKTEFRKLCDKLRKHLEDICKLPTQVANVSISKPETQQLNLETRLYQLDSAIQMELWQEAYKAIEDIHNLMNMSKKLPVPKTMANYYQKLAMVFWKAGNYLFHAAALFKLFQLSKEMKKNITPEELQRMACRVLLATLSIPLPSAHPEFDRFIETDKSPLEKAQRLAILLGLTQPPTRVSLLKDIVRVNVTVLASPQLQNLYNWLEVDFHPLLLCGRVHSVIESLEAEENVALQQYIPALQDVTLVRLVRQIAQVYQTIEFTRLIQLAKFTTAFHMERLLVDCVRHNDMQIRIDHGKQCVHFGMDLSESQREDKPEGPTLQSMPSEQIRNQLVNMATVLHQAIAVINPNKKKAEREKVRGAMVTNYHENKQREHIRILQRHKIIEDRKEYIERLNTVREEEEQRRLEEVAKQQAMAEQKRLEQEREERERKRALNEIQQIKDRHLKEKMQQISQTTHGQKILKKLDEDDIKKMDADQIAAREAEELQKERRELQAKLKSQEKKVDYFERAKRLEEIPLLQASMKERQLQDQAFWEQQEKERIAAALEERKLAVATQERLVRMKMDRDIFLDKLSKERNVVYEDKLIEFEKMLADERAARLAQRKMQRNEKRRLVYLQEKEEEEERKHEEELLREERELILKEEEARKEREEREKKSKEENERKEKEKNDMLDRTAAKQRLKEAEIEKKLQEERDSNRDKGKDGGGWRGGKVDGKRNLEDSSGKDGEPWRPRGGARGGGGAAEETSRDGGKQDCWRRGGDDRKTERRGDDEARRDDVYVPRGGDREERTMRRGEDRDPMRRGEDRDERPSMRRDEREDRPPMRRDEREDRPPMRRDEREDRPPMRRGEDREDRPPMRRGEDREDRPPMRRGEDREDRPSMRRGEDREDRPSMRRGEDRDDRSYNRFRERDDRRRDDKRGDDDAFKGGSAALWRLGGGKDKEDDAPRRSTPLNKAGSGRDTGFEGGGWRMNKDARRDEGSQKREERKGGDDRRGDDKRKDGGGGEEKRNTMTRLDKPQDPPAPEGEEGWSQVSKRR